MNKYKIIIIGHSEFPHGTKKFVEFFGAPSESIRSFNVDENNGIDQLSSKLEEIIKSENNILFFADLTGGSPQKKLMELLIRLGNKTHKVISGIPMSTVLELSIKATLSGFNGDVNEEIKSAIKMSKNQMMLCGNEGIQNLEEKKCSKKDNQGIIEGI